ncbi:MAG TPA: glycosyltransferase [Candidatus Saccharimonadales bacterium]|nr:glycosyltransferase [Candidatus Saccharimonadales bacterium]
MKILQVISMGYVCGGAERSVLLLRDALTKRGHQVKIMASDRDPEQPHYTDYECRHIQGGPLKHLWSMSAYKTLKKAIAEFQPDIVHFHTMGELSPSVLFALGKTPALLTVHGPEEYTLTMLEWYLAPASFNGPVSLGNLTLAGRLHYAFFRYFQRPLYKMGFRHLSGIISPSRYLANQLAREEYDVPIQHIYNGIVLPEQQPLPSEPVILYVGRLEHVKGVDVLLRALPAVVAANPATRLRIVGDGPDCTRLEALAAELGVQHSVTFVGWQKDVVAEYAKARLFVIPSVWPENLPTVALEALAVGRPIVGTAVGGIPELVEDGVSGRVVSPGDSDALAQAITSLLADKQLQTKADVAHSGAKRFTIDEFVTRLESVYAGFIK